MIDRSNRTDSEHRPLDSEIERINGLIGGTVRYGRWANQVGHLAGWSGEPENGIVSIRNEAGRDDKYHCVWVEPDNEASRALAASRPESFTPPPSADAVLRASRPVKAAPVRPKVDAADRPEGVESITDEVAESFGRVGQ